MLSRSRILVVSAGLLLIGALALIFWKLAPLPNQAKLADGRVIQLAGMTEGSSHSLDRGWRGRVSRFLPGDMKRIMGPEFGSTFGFGHSGLALWVMCYDPAKKAYDSDWLTVAYVADEHGCEFPAQGWGATSDGYYKAQVLNFPSYPRSGRPFLFRIYDGQYKKLAELPVVPPERSDPVPDWLPESLPIWKTNGPIVLRLDCFDSPSSARFQVFRDGQPENFWRADNAFFEEARGNRGATLCRKLPAWQWNATLRRTVDAPFSPDEITSLANLTVPDPGVLLSVPVDATVAGKHITNVLLTGPGRFEFSNGTLSASLPWTPNLGGGHGSSSSGTNTTDWRADQHASLLMPRIPLAQGARLIIRATRDGTNFVELTGSGASMSHAYFNFPLNYSTGRVNLDLIADPGYPSSARVSPAAIFGPATAP